MTALDQTAFFQNRRDDIPNQELARKLAESEDRMGVEEIAQNLWNKNPKIQSDCLKVLYEIGYLNPELISGYANDFLKLLHSRNNRFVWGGMIGLSTIAGIAADDIYPSVAEIKKAVEHGSVITVDGGVRTLAVLASTSNKRCSELFPYLLNVLETCRPKSVAQYAEKILVAVNSENKSGFIAVLDKRLEDLTSSQSTRVKRVIKQANQCEA